MMRMYRRQSSGRAANVASLMLLAPPLAATETHLLFGDRPTALQIAGFAIALAGVFLCNPCQRSRVLPGEMDGAARCYRARTGRWPLLEPRRTVIVASVVLGVGDGAAARPARGGAAGPWPMKWRALHAVAIVDERHGEQQRPAEAEPAEPVAAERACPHEPAHVRPRRLEDVVASMISQLRGQHRGVARTRTHPPPEIVVAGHDRDVDTRTLEYPVEPRRQRRE